MVKSTVAFRSSILCFPFQCQAVGADGTSCANTAPPTTGIHTEPPLAISATSPTGASHENPAPSNTTTAPMGLNPSLPRQAPDSVPMAAWSQINHSPSTAWGRSISPPSARVGIPSKPRRSKSYGGHTPCAGGKRAAAVHQRNGLDNRQAEAVAVDAVDVAPCRVDAIKAVKQPGQMALFDRFSRVGYRDLHAVVFGVDRDLDAGACRGVLDGVLQQIGQCAAKQRGFNQCGGVGVAADCH